MPIYEYACSDCGHTFEALVRSDTVPQCPQCQSTSLEKQLSVFATTASTPDSAPMMPGPCGSCPNAMGVAAGPNMSDFSRFQNAQLIEAKFATEELRHDV